MSTFTLEPIPIYQPITAKSEERITSFLNMVMEHSKSNLPTLFRRAVVRGTSELPTAENDLRLMAYAFLVARQWNVKAAVKMAANASRFWDKFHLGESSPFPSPFSLRGYDQTTLETWSGLPPQTTNSPLYRCMQTMTPLMHIGFHYWDRRGLPVLYWLPGRMDMHSVLRKGRPHMPVGVTVPDFFQLFGGGIVDLGWTLCGYQDALLKAHPIAGIDMGAPRRNFVTIVVDCKDLSYKSINGQLLEETKRALKQMTCVFADFIHRIVLVNCPSMIRFAYSLLKSVLDDGLQKKMTFVSPENSMAALDSVVGLERVPTFLGGKCNCEGGCIESFNPNAALSAEEVSGEGDVVTENITLSPGKRHEKVFELRKGEEVIWEFTTTKGIDLRFSVMFYPSQKGVGTRSEKGHIKMCIDPSVKDTLSQDPVVKQEKLRDGADSYLAPSDGILQLVWDNTKSIVSDKGIQMRVYKSDAVNESFGVSNKV